MKRAALLVCLTSLAGCSTDSANSLSRDYRNLNNEAIDALMMATTEERAQLAKTKILKPYNDRLQAIDKRFDSWVQNTDDKLVMLDTLSSESVATLVAETPVNLKRMELEQRRLAAVMAARAKEGVDVRKVCPAMDDLASGNGLGPLKVQLERGNKFQEIIFRKFVQDKRWQNLLPGDMQKELKDQLDDRLKALALGP